MSLGLNGSMRAEVVGPADPIALPGRAGVGPTKYRIAPSSEIGNSLPSSIARHSRL